MIAGLKVKFKIGDRVSYVGRKGVVESCDGNNITVLLQGNEYQSKARLDFLSDGRLETWHSQPMLYLDKSMTEGQYFNTWLAMAKKSRINISYNDCNHIIPGWEKKWEVKPVDVLKKAPK